MFGHQDDKHKGKSSHKETVIAPDAPADDQPADTANNAGDIGIDDQTGQVTPASDASTDNGGASDDSAHTDNLAAQNDDTAWQHPGEPIDTEPEQINDIVPPAGGSTPVPAFTPSHPTDANDYHGSSDSDDSKLPHELIDIKQKALHELSPLMGQLDLAPEDKFRTLMMMIQASDDQKLVKEAYEAAEAIKDEKIRAQALFDIVNEINYFTQHPGN